MTMDDYDFVLALWKSTPGLQLREVDSREAIERYLRRNPGLSFVAEDNGELVGGVMSGYDGRRGHLLHLVVKPTYRRQGLGKVLCTKCVMALQALGIAKTHIFVLKTNETGQTFWATTGWRRVDEAYVYSYNTSSNANA
jgi:ribosomal protein S18 acetylase RimI-like enzyme